MIQSVWKNLTGLQKAAEHLWCDFKWDTNSSPNTNDLYIHYMDKSTGTPSLEEKKTLPNGDNKDINILKDCVSASVAAVLKRMKWLYPYVIGVCWRVLVRLNKHAFGAVTETFKRQHLREMVSRSRAVSVPV